MARVIFCFSVSFSAGSHISWRSILTAVASILARWTITWTRSIQTVPPGLVFNLFLICVVCPVAGSKQEIQYKKLDAVCVLSARRYVSFRFQCFHCNFHLKMVFGTQLFSSFHALPGWSFITNALIDSLIYGNDFSLPFISSFLLHFDRHEKVTNIVTFFISNVLSTTFHSLSCEKQ